ncbi:hypothetical protein D9M69_608040 [compost metagenome]
MVVVDQPSIPPRIGRRIPASPPASSMRNVLASKAAMGRSCPAMRNSTKGFIVHEDYI